jgi:hypothetical protein
MWVVMVIGGGFFWLKKERPTMVEREREREREREMATNMWLERQRAIGDVVLLWVFLAVGREGRGWWL